MLKRDITYETFDGDTVTETFYFNLTKSEIIELEVSVDGGLEQAITKMIESEDIKSLFEQIKQIIKLAIGERSADGKRFIKTPEIQDGFLQTAAYDALFMDLASDDGAAADFIKGILPQSLVGELELQTQNTGDPTALQMVRDADQKASTQTSAPPPPPSL